MSCSNRKRHANRLNAQKSTGPKTDDGKRKSSQNATTHGIFCHDLVLPGEDEGMFHLIREGLIKSLRPMDLMELLLVDRIVTATWKLRRLQTAERMLLERQAERDRENAHERAWARGEEESAQAQPIALLDRAETVERLEHRIEGSMHRAMRELDRRQRERRKREKEGEETGEIESPYLAADVERPSRPHPEAAEAAGTAALQEVDATNCGASPAAQKEPKDPQLHADERLTPSPSTLGEGGGEGRAAAGTDEDPHPNPLPVYRAREQGAYREREEDEHRPME